MCKFHPKDVEKFVREYVTKLEMLVSGIYRDVRIQGYDLGIPLQFPVSVQVFLNERGLYFYFDKQDFFDFKIINERKKNARWSHFILKSHFEKWKENGYAKALFDVKRLYVLPEVIESFREQDLKRMGELEAQYIDDITAEIDFYIDYLKESEKIIEESKKNNLYEIYDMFEIIINYNSRMDIYFKTGSSTCFDTWATVIAEIESSFFLALHGSYFSAIALLRKVFEVPCRSIFIDHKIESDKSYEDLKQRWFSGENFPILYHNMINELITDEEINTIKPFLYLLYGNDINIRTRLIELYKELSIYVHLRPKESFDELYLFFSEYDKDELKNFHDLFVEIITLTDILFLLKNPSSVDVLDIYNYPNIGSKKMAELIKILKSSDSERE